MLSSSFSPLTPSHPPFHKPGSPCCENPLTFHCICCPALAAFPSPAFHSPSKILPCHCVLCAHIIGLLHSSVTFCSRPKQSTESIALKAYQQFLRATSFGLYSFLTSSLRLTPLTTFLPLLRPKTLRHSCKTLYLIHTHRIHCEAFADLVKILISKCLSQPRNLLALDASIWISVHQLNATC